MTIAERTREAVDRHPFLVEGLRAGVINYTAAARYLDIGETDAVAAALRRYADELPARDSSSESVRLRMITGVGDVGDGDGPLVAVNGREYVQEEGDCTAIQADGRIAVASVGEILWRLGESGIEPRSVGVADDRLLLVISRGDGPAVLRVVEEATSVDPRD